jgi:hypothetical protein
MNEVLNNLALIEKQLPELTFTQEQCDLSQLNKDFAPFLEKNFYQWFEKFSEDKDRFQVLINFFNLVLSFLGNLNTDFTERIWIYWVGGFAEIEFVLQSCKK